MRKVEKTQQILNQEGLNILVEVAPHGWNQLDLCSIFKSDKSIKKAAQKRWPQVPQLFQMPFSCDAAHIKNSLCEFWFGKLFLRKML